MTRPSQRYEYTAECQHCNPGSPISYPDSIQRDDEAQRHSDQTGHLVAVGYIDHNEDAPL